MGNNIFLEGPIQTGKSTRIRKVLGNQIHRCGGFACQRLMDVSGNIVGFRLGSPGSTPIDAFVTYEKKSPHALRFIDGSTPDNVFKYRDHLGISHIDTSVFDNAGVELMKVKPTQRFMLLDEIGGVELGCSTFVTALFDLLESDTPCVGVIKTRTNMEKIGDPEIALAYDELRHRILSGQNSRIILHRPR